MAREEPMDDEEDVPSESSADEEDDDDAASSKPSGKKSREDRAPILYTEDQIASLNLRFTVGEDVICNLGDGRVGEGVVVKRFYRETDWPHGQYAAYQIRLHHTDGDGNSLIYAPRDDNCYVKRLESAEKIAVQVDRRLSRERQLMRSLEASFNDSLNDKKHMLYDTLKTRHKKSMQRVIADLSRGAAIPA